MTWGIRGVIEGFYGTPWSWADRATVMRWGHARGMTHYVYAPKDDPLHREAWRDPYPDETCDRFASLASEGTLSVGFAISPGLSIDYDDEDDRRALAAKVDQVVAVGVGSVWLALDDIRPEPGLGLRHAALTTWLHAHLQGRAELVLVPTEYTGTASTPYLDALAEGVPRDLPIAWTGATVVCDEITGAQAAARAAALGGRPPLVWDNYPVNDSFMVDRLFMGPLRGRDPALAAQCTGYVANPMSQAHASLAPLASIAAYLLGDDEIAAWETAADELGVRALAEACDGELPRMLVRAIVTASAGTRPARLADTAAWLDRLDACTPDAALAREIAPWAAQVSVETGVWRSALRVLDALADGKVRRATDEGLGLAFIWPGARRAPVTVFGDRCGIRPVLGQWPNGDWRFDLASVTEDRNATDALVRFTLAELAAGAPTGEGPPS